MPITISRTVADPVAATDNWKLAIHRQADGTTEVVFTYFPADGGKALVATLNNADITAAMRTAGSNLFAAVSAAAIPKFQERG